MTGEEGAVCLKKKKRVLEAAPGKAGERVVFVLAVEGAKKRNKAPVLCWDAC